MEHTIGDGIVALALAGGIVGYVYVTHRTRQKKLELIHKERMAAMEKGIPLAELPLEAAEAPGPSDPDHVLPIMGTTFFCLSTGAMIALYFNLPASSHGLWIAPLPLAFLGLGLIAFHFFKGESGR